MVCAPLTSRFPPLTRKRAMTAERYGPTLPTGGYLVVDHALSSWPSPFPGSYSFHSADFREYQPGQKYTTALKALIFRITAGKYRRFTAGSGMPGGRRDGGSGAAASPCRPAAARDASPEVVRRPEGDGPLLLMTGRTTARPGLRPGKVDLRILFLSRRTELSADSCVLAPRGRRPILGGGVQSHMGYHGNHGRRVAMQCQLAFHAIARNNSATARKSGRPHG
jgi:hypothetical protein